MSVLLAVVKKIWSIKRYIVLIATPLILLPILFTLPPKAHIKPSSNAEFVPIQSGLYYTMSVLLAVVKKIWSIKRYIVLIATPLILLPILFTLPPKIKAGWLMNLMGVLLLSLAMSIWAPSIFQLDTFPGWVHLHSNNVTSFDVLHNITKGG